MVAAMERQLGQMSWEMGRLSESVQRSMQEQAAKNAREIAALKQHTKALDERLDTTSRALDDKLEKALSSLRFIATLVQGDARQYAA